MNVTQKIISSHLVDGKLKGQCPKAGEEIALNIDQTLLQDATGTVAMLEFESLGISRVKSSRCTVYVDHNMLQTGFENPDDHLFLQTIASKYGAYFSRPGNGISHQAALERLDIPGQTMLGADSHTPQAGAMAMLAIGAGGFEVAAAMAGQPYLLKMPQIVQVKLTGELQPWVSAKDIILELLRRCTVSGGIGKIFEYGGPGLKNLNVPQRSTIANMGAELGLTSTVFPSDEQTKRFLKAQKRERDFQPLTAEDNGNYDDVLELDLSKIEPLVAQPHSPDAVVPVQEIAGTELKQVSVGSSVNSSYMDLMTAAKIVEGKKIHPGLHMTISPGSRQVLVMVTRDGGMMSLIQAGARGLEVACGPCIGMGMAPPSGGNSLRTFNRNFPGRSGTADDRVYLASPEIAAASAVNGVITDPRTLGKPPKVEMPKEFAVDDSGFLPPADNPDKIQVVRGPNIKPLPAPPELKDVLEGPVLIKLGDNISTDGILPAGAKILPLRSNIPAIAEYVFNYIDKTFPARARQKGPGFIVAGKNYGQGSSREHAAIAPMFLGVRSVITVSFARIHQDNLVNFGILPLRFAEPEKYDKIEQEDVLVISGIMDGLKNAKRIKMKNQTKNFETELTYELTSRQVQILLKSGLAGYLKGRK